jgi:hypothetical protein
MNGSRTRAVLILLVLLVAIALPIPAAANTRVVGVTGTEEIVAFNDVLVHETRGVMFFDSSGTTRLICSSPYLTGTSSQVQETLYVIRADKVVFEGSFTIALDAGGEWRGRYHGGFDGAWWGEFVGRGYGGEIDGATLHESITNGVVFAEVKLAN